MESLYFIPTKKKYTKRQAKLKVKSIDLFYHMKYKKIDKRSLNFTILYLFDFVDLC